MSKMLTERRLLAGIAVTLLLGESICPATDEFDQAPIRYSESTPDNEVSKLQSQIESGELTLSYDEKKGYLPAILEALSISAETQMLVFSKTSMQRNRISPRTPRAIYFNDDTYVGYCHAGNVIEASAVDPQLGVVFYTIEQKESPCPTLKRQTQSCLQCHGLTQMNGIPGLLTRSVFTGASGLPILSEGSRRVDHSTPIKDRWGGWYVTGQHGDQPHMGNLIIRDRNAPHPLNNADGENVADLTDRLRVANYLTPHSDIVALMVFEHQVLIHNLLTKANFETRRALDYEAEFNRALGEPANNRLESTTRRIKNVGDKLVEGLLFVDEAPIAATIAGSSRFAEKWSQIGPRDARGRSLRDFDLNTRMFKYPCSYLIYSRAFDGLPEAVQTYVVRRLRNVLTGNDPDATFFHLTADDRRAILEILNATKPGLWKQ